MCEEEAVFVLSLCSRFALPLSLSLCCLASSLIGSPLCLRFPRSLFFARERSVAQGHPPLRDISNSRIDIFQPMRGPDSSKQVVRIRGLLCARICVSICILGSHRVPTTFH